MKKLVARKTRYGQTTLLEKVATIAWLTLLPLRILYRLCFQKKDEKRSNLRIANETIGRTCTDNLPYNQIQFVQPGALRVWRSYVTAKERTIDELCTGAKLLWLGSKQLDEDTDVFLVVHGGGFMFPLSDLFAGFSCHVRNELSNRNKRVCFAILAYRLYPIARYPDQLRDACAALSLILNAGVPPSRIHLIGESAGGNIILQLLSHILHPNPLVEVLHLASDKLGSVMLMSPWVSPTVQGGQDDSQDMISEASLRQWGQLFLEDVPSEHMPYVEPLSTPEKWFSDFPARRILVTSGSVEGMAPAHKLFVEKLKRDGAPLTFIVEEGGCHDGMICDFPMSLLRLVMKPDPGDVVRMVVDWLAEAIA